MRWLPLASLAASLALAAAASARADQGDTLVMKHDPERYRIVVTATRTARDLRDVPGSAAVVSGAELRRRGARTLADALHDVTGLDAGDGSDNGARLPNPGLWGLREFDALLVTLDGVPVGGPFNPSLAQIPVEDIERIEVLKGPQGSLYGVSAFAGAIHVITRRDSLDEVAVSGGEFGALDASGTWHRALPGGGRARLTAAALRDRGWQDRTGSTLDRAGATLTRPLGRTDATLDLRAFRDDQRFGTPVPFDTTGEPRPGFAPERNYAVSGAHVEHRVWAATARTSTRLPAATRLENTLGVTRDRQTFLRSFFTDFPDPDTAGSEGVELEPRETSVFDDLRWIAPLELAGAHELVSGAAITWGRTQASGVGFDFDQALSSYPLVPGVPGVVGDHRSFDDRRTFAGLYAHDSWTPQARFTLSGGGRFDAASERLDTRFQETGHPAEAGSDAKHTNAWSGDLDALVRLAPASWRALGTLNLFGNWKSSFKPAAPNLTEAEAAEILDPERTHSLEAGLKASAFDDQVSLEASLFRMDFENLVVANLDTLGNPQLLNAGRERFKGWELSLELAPVALPGVTLAGGYAHHDARFVRFTFVDPDGNFLDVSGNRLELTPAEMWNASIAYRAPFGGTAWAALRHQGPRALDRDNAHDTPGYSEWDAGASWDVGRARLSVTGHNLSDDRHPVSESEIGDSQLYFSPPRRISAQLAVRY